MKAKAINKSLVLINSIHSDVSTSVVMDWIDYLGGQSIRINGDEKIDLISLSVSNKENIQLKFGFRGVKYNLDQFSSFWFRRGNIRFQTDLPQVLSSDTKLEKIIDDHLTEELQTLRNSVHDILNTKRSLGQRNNAIVDKISVLKKAVDCGIEIPETEIVTKKEELVSFIKKRNGTITKSLSDNLSVNSEKEEEIGTRLSMYTEELTIDDSKKLNSFFPTLLQEKLDKEYELRVFFIDDECYSMAIFSQSDEQTELDFRKYNRTTPNRTVPYTIPNELVEKIKKLMKAIDLNTGSLDFVVTKDDKFVFLEVNPVGQFGMVSFPCNYNLEKKIAQYLLKL